MYSTPGAKERPVREIIEPQSVVEGAGVRLKRSIATARLGYLDPFLLFDHFGSDDPEDYVAGFPMHPHRGIETVTYILSGVVNHRDTLGNAGSIRGGDVQWMTAGGGIMHEEMPQATGERLDGFQLWVNLPSQLKMTNPRYQDIPSERIPEVRREDGVSIRVIAGSVEDVSGAVSDIFAAPTYLDVSVPAGVTFSHPVAPEHNAFSYVFDGEGVFGLTGASGGVTVTSPALVVFAGGDHINVRVGDQPVRFLLASGRPLHEPVSRYGPFVMNTREEIEQALSDLRNGTFVKS